MKSFLFFFYLYYVNGIDIGTRTRSKYNLSCATLMLEDLCHGNSCGMMAFIQPQLTTISSFAHCRILCSEKTELNIPHLFPEPGFRKFLISRGSVNRSYDLSEKQWPNHSNTRILRSCLESLFMSPILTKFHRDMASPFN